MCAWNSLEHAQRSVRKASQERKKRESVAHCSKIMRPAPKLPAVRREREKNSVKSLRSTPQSKAELQLLHVCIEGERSEGDTFRDQRPGRGGRRRRRGFLGIPKDSSPAAGTSQDDKTRCSTSPRQQAHICLYSMRRSPSLEPPLLRRDCAHLLRVFEIGFYVPPPSEEEGEGEEKVAARDTCHTCVICVHGDVMHI